MLEGHVYTGPSPERARNAAELAALSRVQEGELQLRTSLVMNSAAARTPTPALAARKNLLAAFQVHGHFT